MLDALKSRKMTGFSASCKNASPLAAPSATFILIAHERAWPWLLPTNTIVINFHQEGWEKRSRIAIHHILVGDITKQTHTSTPCVDGPHNIIGTHKGIENQDEGTYFWTGGFLDCHVAWIHRRAAGDHPRHRIRSGEQDLGDGAVLGSSLRPEYKQEKNEGKDVTMATPYQTCFKH